MSPCSPMDLRTWMDPPIPCQTLGGHVSLLYELEETVYISPTRSSGFEEMG